jgi:outer membrane autotransporter protein
VDGYAQFDTDSQAIALGPDFRVRDDLVIGASLGKTQTDTELSAIGAETEVEGWYGSLYGSAFSDRAYLEGGLSYADQSCETERAVVVDSIARLARADYDGDTWMAFSARAGSTGGRPST